jgi:glycerate 2-kinase
MIDVARAIAGTTVAGTMLGDDAAAVLGAAMRACDPLAWIREQVSCAGTGLQIGERVIVPAPGGVLRMLGIGKAAPAMVAALLDIAGARVIEALAIGKAGTAMPAARPGLSVREGGHPLPDDASAAAGIAALELAARTGPADRLLAVITGGASALAVRPLAGSSLAELRELGETLGRAGVPIAALNAVRGRLDATKHGGLARAAHGRALALVLDDIPGGDPFAVGSGPLHDGGAPPIPAELLERLSPQLRARLERVPAAMTSPVEHVVVADNHTAVAAASATATACGFAVVRGPTLVGEARELGRILGELARAQLHRPFAIVCGGECTVTRRGGGRGGRTLELAIAAAQALDGTRELAVVAFASDGDDGSSGAAGAVVDGSTCTRARAIGCDLAAALRDADSASALARLGDLLITGPSGTNVGDVVLALGR